MQLIEVDRVLKQRGDTFTLGPLSLQLAPGEVLGIMGPNGAGKTTLLRLLWGFLRPDRGAVSVLGMTPHLQQIRMRRRAGFVGDSTRFYEWMTASPYLAFVSGFYPGFDSQHAAGLLDGLGVAGKTGIRQMSRGNRVKLALVAALAHRPDLLILDEPTSGLDPVVRAQFLRLLGELSGKGVGIVLSSHLSGDLDRLADTILMLDRGQPIEYAPARTLLDRYRHAHLEDVFLNALERVSASGPPNHP
jgi:ABC-2 type transport system ATP-binding protein